MQHKSSPLIQWQFSCWNRVWRAAVSSCSDDDFDMSRYSSSGYSSAEVRCLRDQVSTRTHSTVSQHRVVTLQPRNTLLHCHHRSRLTPGIRALLGAGAHGHHETRPSIHVLPVSPPCFFFPTSDPGLTTLPSPPPPPSGVSSLLTICGNSRPPLRTLTDGLILTTLKPFRNVGLQTDGSKTKKRTL